MINFKDEILNGEPKYRIRDNNGNILFDNCTIEQITETLQQPTPLNNETISNIQDNIQLNRIYNKINATKICEEYNGIPDDMFRSDKYPYSKITSPTGDFNSYGAYGYGNYKVYEQYRGSSSTMYDVVTIIDGNDSTGCDNSFSSSSSPFYYYFKYPTEIKVKKVRIVAEYSYTNIYFQGSKDGTTYTDIADLASVGTNGEISIKNDEYYKYYRIGLFYTSIGTRTSSINSIQFTEVYGNMEKFNLLTSELDVRAYENNMRILIEPYQIAPDYPNYFKFKNLSEKLINGTLENGKKYELVYDGTLFNAKEVV